MGKIVAKCEVNNVMELTKALLGDLQLGCASKGTEHIVKVIQTLWERDSPIYFAELDLRNAFNEMPRKVTRRIFQILEEEMRTVLGHDGNIPGPFQGLVNQLYTVTAIGYDDEGYQRISVWKKVVLRETQRHQCYTHLQHYLSY